MRKISKPQGIIDTLSMRISLEEKGLIKSFAKFKGRTVSELVRTSVLKVIESDLGEQRYDEALRTLENDPDCNPFKIKSN